jgi:Bacterial Ig domain
MKQIMARNPLISFLQQSKTTTIYIFLLPLIIALSMIKGFVSLIMPLISLLGSIKGYLYFINRFSMDLKRSWQQAIAPLKSLILPLILFLNFVPMFGQNEIELAVNSYTTPPTGPIYTAQVATLLENTTGTTFAAYTPTLTVTASLSNQQYTATGMATGAMAFGATISAGTSPVGTVVFNKMNTIGGGTNGTFTSTASGTAGSGIDVINNYAFYMYNCVTPLFTASSPLVGRYYYADLTLTFNRPVSNPVLQIEGLGGTSSTAHGHSAELDLQTTGLTLSKLSGTTELSVSGNQILNNAATIGATCGSGGACGSVLVSGSNITTLTFKVYIRGAGGGAWGAATTNTGDSWMIGVSLAKISGSVVSDCNGMTDGAINGQGTNAGGLYAILVNGTNKIVESVAVPSNGTYLFTAPVAGTYNVILSTTTGSVGATAPAPSLPAGWTSSGEGETAAGDGTVNTSTTIVVGTASIAGVNFGIQKLFVATIAETDASCTANDDKILNGGSATLTANGGGTYSWSNGATTAATSVSPTVSTTYTVTVTNGGGCVAVNRTVNIVSAPTAAIAETDASCTANDNKIISGASANLTASGGTSYAWDNSLPATAGPHSVSPTTTTTYNVTVTDANGCTATANKTITIVTAPTAAIAVSGTTTVNIGDSRNLTASGGSTYSWSTGAIINPITVSPIATTTYSVTATDANGCTGSASQILTINRAPIALDDTTGTYKNTAFTNKVSFNDKDPDNNLNATSFLKIDNPKNGGIVFNSNGTYTYTPTTGFLGRDSIHYKVCDNGTPALCDTAVLVFTIVTPLCTGQLSSTSLVNITFGSGGRDNLPNVVPGAVTDQLYSASGGVNDNYYAIANNGNIAGGWASNVSDHTDGSVTGRLMVINAAHHDTIEFLRLPVAGLCTNTTYQFSAWIRSIYNGSDFVNVSFDIRNPTTDEIVYSVGSGSIAHGAWYQHGFTFNTGSSTNFVFVLRNNNPAGNSGNDLVLDDIQFTHCGPSLSAVASGSTTVCTGSSVTLNGNLSSGYIALSIYGKLVQMGVLFGVILLLQLLLITLLPLQYQTMVINIAF